MITVRSTMSHCTLVKVSPWLSRYRSLVITYRCRQKAWETAVIYVSPRMHSNSHSHKLGEIVSRDPVGRVGETRLGRQAPGSIAARRAEGRGRRGPPAARRPSRCRGTASSTLQQQPSKRTISQPQWRRTPGSAPDRAKSRALRARIWAHTRAHTQPEAHTRATKERGETD